MRVLVCGGRDYNDSTAVFNVLDCFVLVERDISVIIHGAAKGADSLAGAWARSRKVAEAPFPAEWNKWGRSAGFRRNEDMLSDGKPDLVIAFPGGNGTKRMVKKAIEAGVKVRCVGWEC